MSGTQKLLHNLAQVGYQLDWTCRPWQSVPSSDTCILGWAFVTRVPTVPTKVALRSCDCGSGLTSGSFGDKVVAAVGKEGGPDEV